MASDWEAVKEALGSVEAVEALSRLEAEHQRLRLREPSRDEMERALGDGAETFLDGWTVRRCIDCRAPVAGGPTRCYLCVGRIEGAQRLEAEHKRLLADNAALVKQLAAQSQRPHAPGVGAATEAMLAERHPGDAINGEVQRLRVDSERLRKVLDDLFRSNGRRGRYNAMEEFEASERGEELLLEYNKP